MLSVVAVCLALACVASGQPLVCREEVECPEKYYCETDAHVCRECLSCQALKRDPPADYTPCIKSVAVCGACYKGLVPDRHRGDVNAECVPPDSAMSDGMASYLWLFIIVGLAFFGLVVGIIAYVVRNPEIFKTPATSQPNVTARITASAPEAPPPYNYVPPAPYKDARPDSPPNHYTDGGHGNAEFEDSRFIVHPPPRADGRVPEASQTAKVYNKPAYMREPRSPSPDLMSEPDEATGFTIIDEETTMSTWTPNGVASNEDVNANAVANTDATALMPVVSLQDPTPAKKRCVRQDSNNNRNRESSDESDRSPSPGQSAPSINLTQIFNVQINK